MRRCACRYWRPSAFPTRARDAHEGAREASPPLPRKREVPPGVLLPRHPRLPTQPWHHHRDPEPADQAGHRLRRGSAGGRPPTFDAGAYKGRNVIERAFAHIKQWRGLATRYDKHAIIYRAGLILASIMLWLRPQGDTL